jgi:acyl-CoA thioesterase-2
VALHQSVLAYASDFSLLDTALIAYGRVVFDPQLLLASLDHVLWFHRDFRADDWLLYVQDSPSAEGARALCRGTVFSRDGRLVASVAQEGLVRQKRRPETQGAPGSGQPGSAPKPATDPNGGRQGNPS